MKYRVTTPVPDHSGEIAGVHFVKGVAEVEASPPLPRLTAEERQELTREQQAEYDNARQDPAYRAMAYFRSAGYGVEEVDTEPAEEPAVDEPAMPAKNASTEEWRAYAKAKGMPPEQADATGRDQLAAHYTKEADQ